MKTDLILDLICEAVDISIDDQEKTYPTQRRTIHEKFDISVENDVVHSSEIENDKRRKESSFNYKTINQSIDMELDEENLDNNKYIKGNYNDNVYQKLFTNNIDESTDNNNSSTQNMFETNSRYFTNRDEMNIEQNSLKVDLDDIKKNTSLDLKEKISEHGDKIQKNEVYSNLNNQEKFTNIQFKPFGEK